MHILLRKFDKVKSQYFQAIAIYDFSDHRMHKCNSVICVCSVCWKISVLSFTDRMYQHFSLLYGLKKKLFSVSALEFFVQRYIGFSDAISTQNDFTLSPIQFSFSLTLSLQNAGSSIIYILSFAYPFPALELLEVVCAMGFFAKFSRFPIHTHRTRVLLYIVYTLWSNRMFVHG